MGISEGFFAQLKSKFNWAFHILPGHPPSQVRRRTLQRLGLSCKSFPALVTGSGGSLSVFPLSGHHAPLVTPLFRTFLCHCWRKRSWVSGTSVHHLLSLSRPAGTAWCSGIARTVLTTDQESVLPVYRQPEAQSHINPTE